MKTTKKATTGKTKMQNKCLFSPCRNYRYSLRHDIASAGTDFFAAEESAKGHAVWIALNPSKADEERLDPTLKRIRVFSAAFGFGGFVMLNLFAWRETKSKKLPKVAEPIGPENDRVILETAKAAPYVICCWGTSGSLLKRDEAVVAMLKANGIKTMYLRKTKDGYPEHPLYIPGETEPKEYEIGV